MSAAAASRISCRSSSAAWAAVRARGRAGGGCASSRASATSIPSPRRRRLAATGRSSARRPCAPPTASCNDLHGEVGVSLEEAILGARVEVATCDGRVTVTIPAGTSSGRRLRLRGKGIAGGDQYVTVQIVVPERVDEKTAELVRELGRRAPVQPRR